MSAGITRDVWSAIAPDLAAPALQRIIAIGNRTLPPQDAGIAIGYLARAYLAHPPPAQFRLIVSPLVMWIWIGGLIAFGGGLIALWPPPSALRRRARAAARTRVAQGLARA
jgi:cytochrome c-type biogenesis protein CcmF